MSQLDPVQIAALDFARDKPGVMWDMEMGLGKTLCAEAEFHWYVTRNRVDRGIVVCPNSFKMGWLDEMEKHGFRFDIHIFETSKKSAASQFFNRPVHNRIPLLVINYEALRMHAILLAVCTWASRGQTYLAIDESIAIKGPKSLQMKAVHKLASLCRYVRCLTGKPQSQGPHDLWGQLRAIGVFADRNFYAFRGAFCVMGGWEQKEVVAAKNVDILANYMKPVVFVAKKKDWLPKLPRKDYTIRDYQMSAEQLAQYWQMERDFLLEIEKGVIMVDVAIAKYEKLAQIQTGFIYDDQMRVHSLVDVDKNPRLNLLIEIIEEEVAGKVCIVYRHRAVAPMLADVLHGYNHSLISGGMKPEEISEEKQRFNEDPTSRAILLQADASKYGHTLLGGPGPDDLCQTMIFFENSYNADTRAQIEDRIHRRGQVGERVLYIDLSGSPLDRRIVKALQRKEALFKEVFKNLKAAEPA